MNRGKHNKHIKNRSTALRWTSLALRLLCGRYAQCANYQKGYTEMLQLR
jgi:hypothetical protein